MAELRWEPPPPDSRAAADEVHLWRASLHPPAGVLRELAATLAADERAQAALFRFPEHRDRFVAGRGIQRAILARYLGEPPGGLRFRFAAHGKPELDGPAARSGVRFNASNAGGRALYAVALGREVGVDLEPLRPIPNAPLLAARFFSPAERAALERVPRSQVDAAFLNAWTRKEACIKAAGEGLAMPLHAFDVTLAPGEPARLLGTRPGALDADRWTLHAVDAGPGWVAALAVEGTGWSVRGFEWGEES